MHAHHDAKPLQTMMRLSIMAFSSLPCCLVSIAEVWQECRWLMAKFLVAYWRSPSYNLTRICMTVLIALLYGTFFYKKAHIPATGGPPDFRTFSPDHLVLMPFCSDFGPKTLMPAVLPMCSLPVGTSDLSRHSSRLGRAAGAVTPWSGGLLEPCHTLDAKGHSACHTSQPEEGTCQHSIF